MRHRDQHIRALVTDCRDCHLFSVLQIIGSISLIALMLGSADGLFRPALTVVTLTSLTSQTCTQDNVVHSGSHSHTPTLSRPIIAQTSLTSTALTLALSRRHVTPRDVPGGDSAGTEYRVMKTMGIIIDNRDIGESLLDNFIARKSVHVLVSDLV